MSECFGQNTVLINVNIPEKQIERNIEWNLNETVQSLKLYVLKIVPGLDDPLNYGFFLPPSNGKNGKFLQEERILDHYSPDESFKLELRKKIRLYHLSINSPKLKKINSKSYQKQFIQYIRNGDVMKINKNLYDGIDPNFHIPGIPETPLSLACRLKDPHVIIMALANNGAYLDFRSSDSLTALHKTSIEGLYEPMKTLLQLGQSPNCKDNRGYTPLYYCIENDAPGECVQLLLFEHSILGIRDEHGLQEIHKACLYGRTKHLDHLISYGADIDAKTNKGNTALHICALHNQGACARLLLYRGITRHALNDENKSAYQTALLSNNLELADLIQNFRDEDVVPVTNLPKFNEKRRSIILSMKRFSSLGQLSNGSDSINQDNQTISSDEIISLNGSINSLPQGVNSTPNTPQRLSNFQRKSESLECQSLHNFPSLKSKENFTHLNTWTSSADNGKVNTKTRLPIASIVNSKMENIPRVVVLQKCPVGFGFIIRGTKNDPEVEFIAKPSMPATHYFEGIAENSPSQRAGLLSGDFLLEVNNIDVHKMPHNEVVRIIQMAGDNLTMKVITVNHAAASNGLFDGCSDAKSCSDSVSLMSDNTVSMGACQSNCVFEGTSDSREVQNGSIQRFNQIPRQNLSPLLPADSKEDDFIKLKLKANSQNNKKNFSGSDNIKSVKGPAPPPPLRADNTLLTASRSSNDIISTYSHDNYDKVDYYISDATITPNELSSSNRSIGQQISISTGSSKSLSKVYIPPADYNSDVNVNLQSRNGQYITTEPSITPALVLPESMTVPAPPPPPPPPLSVNVGPIQSTPSPHFHNLDKALLAVSLKPVIHNDKDNTSDDLSTNLSSHDKALRDAIFSHRKKVECGETITADIDCKLKESKVGNKSIVFEASPKPTLVLDKSKLKADSDVKITPTAPNKNPPLKPKPVPQTFFAAGNNKLPVASVIQNADGDNLKHNESNLRIKAEQLRTDLVKKEQEIKKGTLYFTNSK